jgi:hypothetical protein
VSPLVRATGMLSLGVSLFAQDKGLGGLVDTLGLLSKLIEQEREAHGSMGSSIMSIRLPELPKDQYQLAVDQLGGPALAFIKQGYPMETVGIAMRLQAKRPCRYGHLERNTDKKGSCAVCPRLMRTNSSRSRPTKIAAARGPFSMNGRDPFIGMGG